MMLQGWRWYGPDDPVSLDDIRQAGATDVVTALHQVPIGEAWTRADVAARKHIIENGQPGRSPLTWSVVELIPIPDDVKRLGAKATRSIEAWIASLEAVAVGRHQAHLLQFHARGRLVPHRSRMGAAERRPRHALRPGPVRGVRTAHPAAPGSRGGIFAKPRRPGRSSFMPAMTQADIDYLVKVIASALPGSTTEPLTIPQFRDRLQQYRGINSAVLRQHLIEFLARVTPVAEALGVTLTLHPDDPPRPLFGLPRIASSAEDYQALFDAVPSKANGICFCTGSLGVRAENDLPAMAKRFAPRIGFAHLRATKREADGLSFFESDHLDGDVDMIAVLKALLAENRKRSAERPDRVPAGPRPSHAGRSRRDQAHQSRLHRDRPAAGTCRTARRDPRHRACGVSVRFFV